MFCVQYVKSELFFRTLNSSRKTKNLKRYYEFTQRFTSLPYNDLAIEHYAKIRLNLERKGNPIGPNDLLIAAIALANDLTLVTHNKSEFGRVTNLKIVDWVEE